MVFQTNNLRRCFKDCERETGNKDWFAGFVLEISSLGDLSFFVCASLLHIFVTNGCTATNEAKTKHRDNFQQLTNVGSVWRYTHGPDARFNDDL